MGALFAIGQLTKGGIGSLFFAVIFGALGASVALLRNIFKAKEAYFTRYDGKHTFPIFMHLLYGTVLAGVAYLLFVSQILSNEGTGSLLTSNLFPDFSCEECKGLDLFNKFRKMQPSDLTDAGKMFVWCFIAGYSEKFVTGILDQLQSKVSPSNGDAQ